MSRITTVVAFATLLSNALASPSNTTGPIVNVNSAKYLGHHNTTLNINQYFSIPYAAPPVGSLRYKPPRSYILPSNLTKDIPIDATTSGPSCVQGYPYWTGASGVSVPGSEDCLTLHVFTPDTATVGAKLPVLFSIHGGGYVIGDADLVTPFALMKHTNNAFVFVSIQYRLGAYGFVGGSRYAKEGGAQNVGLLDQRLALEWAQKNIAAFGGDPERVTILGGSAGGGSVTAMLAWEGGVAKPPFRGAIADYPWWQQYLTEEQLENQYALLLEASGCEGLACLQEVPEDVLKNATQGTYVTAYTKGAYGYGNFYYGPYVDGKYLKGIPSREFKAGHFSKVPTLTSREGYEGFGFSNQSMTTVEEERIDLKTQFPYANETFIDKVYKLYPSGDFNSTFFHRQTWFGDISIDCPTRYIASSISASNTSVYKQLFNAGTQIHGSTGPFLGDLDYASEPGANVTLANLYKDYYISFAIHLDPNEQSWSNVSKPVWPDYKTGDVLSFNYTELGAVSDVYYDNTEKCQFFWDNGDVVQN
ncbi:alpha/beta-hydrolase [Massarina eburnea CBS 473.64]|uniref:Carboxylic ester hydrolase n=1 Tax=Massarina eburnea CBS 473.64 TaxID=1395130 RepID=A0A6A6SEF7_9PLEO|nr:alpha/beta-hydrolase [Massarina eburnea CBS 473.64]